MQLTSHLRMKPSTRRVLSCIAGFALLVIVGVTDYLTGYEMPFLVFYFPSVVIVSWSGRRDFAVSIAAASACVWFAADLVSHHPYSSEFYRYWTVLIWFLVFLSVAALVLQLRRLSDGQQELNKVVRHALVAMLRDANQSASRRDR